MRGQRVLEAWVAIELNLMFFVGVLVAPENTTRRGPAKYFVVQALGSSLLIISVFFSSAHSGSGGIFTFMGLTGLVLKLGLAPFHVWLVTLLPGLSWGRFFLASTVQKILPLSVLCHFLGRWAGYLVVLSSVAGLMGRWSQPNIKKLMAYSSVYSGGWLVVARRSYRAWLGYLGAYRLGLGAFLALAYFSSGGLLPDLLLEEGERGVILIFLRLLSLAGRPPTIGFVAKVVVLRGTVVSGLFFLPLVLTLRAGGMLYAYMRLFLLSTSRGGGLAVLPGLGQASKVSCVVVLGVRGLIGLWLRVSV